MADSSFFLESGIFYPFSSASGNIGGGGTLGHLAIWAGSNLLGSAGEPSLALLDTITGLTTQTGVLQRTGVGAYAFLGIGGANGLVQLTSVGKLPALDGSLLTNLSSAVLSGALPALNGSALTSLTAANLIGALPAISGALLTSLTASYLTGALPAISGAALTALPPLTGEVTTSGLAATINKAITPIWTGLHSFVGSNTAPLAADGAQVAIQNSSLTQETMFNPLTGGVVFDGIRSTINIPAGGTALQGNSFGAYIRSRSGTGNTLGNGVLFYGLATAGANNTCVWGANYRLTDSEDATGHSYTGVELLGVELDYLVTSAATVVQGYGLIYAANITWTGGGNGFQVTNQTPQFGKLNSAFVSGNAAAATALSVGGLAASATSGVGGPSQVLSLNWWDTGTPSVLRASSLFADALGNLNWSFTSSGASGLLLNASAGTTVQVQFLQAGTAKWEIGALTTGHFFAFDQTAGALVWQMTSGGTFAFTPTVTVPSLLVGSNQVVGARVTGYTAMTGTPDKATAFATGSVTLVQLAERVMQLQADLTTHGLIGT